MPYVMVPVPEEHVVEAMQAVLRISAKASIIDWDAGTVAEMWESVDEAAKSVLSVVARATITRGQVPDVEVAQSIEISNREVLGIVRELNELAASESHPHVISSQTVTENLPNGRTRDQRVLAMSRAVAELIRAAEKAEKEAAPHPLVPGQ